MAKIVIDAGHGLYTSGKRCLASLDPNQTREWVLNDRVADELGQLLVSAGHQILRVDDTDGSSDISLANRVSKANNWGADFYMSVHHDAGVNGGSGGGTTVYVYTSSSAKSKQAQEAIYACAIARAGLKGNRSDGTRSANLYVLRKTSMPACLIECGFMDSSTDIKYILDPAWSKKMALGIAEGICQVFGGTVNANASATSTPTASASTATTTSDIAVDGEWGKGTTRATQKVLGTPVDGIVSGQLTSCKKYLINALPSSWDFGRSGGGSAMVKALQKLVGATVDGLMGKKTVMALQRFLNAKGFNCGTVDGYLGEKTVMAWQRYINSRL